MMILIPWPHRRALDRVENDWQRGSKGHDLILWRAGSNRQALVYVREPITSRVSHLHGYSKPSKDDNEMTGEKRSREAKKTENPYCSIAVDVRI